jgi:hypothetical protein
MKLMSIKLHCCDIKTILLPFQEATNFVAIYVL